MSRRVDRRLHDNVREFTLAQYRTLTEALVGDHLAVPFVEFLQHDARVPRVVLRHDVDRRVPNAVVCATILHEIGVRGSFYFRYPYTFRLGAMERIARMGHEVGYHYEVLSKTRGNVKRALDLFAAELGEFRKYFDVQTVCMHGAPLSRWDNRDIWRHARLSDFGLLGEPYLSLDFGSVYYLTDTGRTWNQGNRAIRDRIDSGFGVFYNHTAEVIEAAHARQLPDQVMVNFHPERWDDAVGPWLFQLIAQGVKNNGKRLLAAWRARRAGSASRDP